MDPVQSQIDSFISLVQEVNQIPGMHIDMNGEVDRQRDSLAFVVNSIYQQFKNEGWQIALKDLPQKIKTWNTPPNAQASKDVLNFIRHLYEERILEILSDPEADKLVKEKAKAIFHLYSTIVDQQIAQSSAKPVSLSGISESLLPQWYMNKDYLKPSRYE